MLPVFFPALVIHRQLHNYSTYHRKCMVFVQPHLVCLFYGIQLDSIVENIYVLIHENRSPLSEFLLFLYNIVQEGDNLNSQDVTRAVIRLEIQRALRGMEATPKRTIRKLADLGKVCAKGSVQKEIFTTFQKLLKNPESSYYQCIEDLVKQVDSETLTTFGMNLGYNGWTYGIRRIRACKRSSGQHVLWISLLSCKNTPDVTAVRPVIEKGREQGVYTYAFLPDTDTSSFVSFPSVFKENPDCAFLWFQPPDFHPEHESLPERFPNVMPLFSRSTLEHTGFMEQLKKNRILYGVYDSYRKQTETDVISIKNLGLLSSLGTPFLFFLSEDEKNDENSVVSHFVAEARLKQAYPFLPIDFYSDIRRIDRLITGETPADSITKLFHRAPSSVSHQ